MSNLIVAKTEDCDLDKMNRKMRMETMNDANKNDSTGSMIEITQKEYDKLTEAEAFLDCLLACGVDNWPGYGDAQEMMKESNHENK